MDKIQFNSEILKSYREGLAVVYKCLCDSKEFIEYMNKNIAPVVPREGPESDMFYYIGWANDNSEAYLGDTIDKVRLALESCEKAIKNLKGEKK